MIRIEVVTNTPAAPVEDLSLKECLDYDPFPQRAGSRQRFKCCRHRGDHQRSLTVDDDTGKFRCHNADCRIWGVVTEKQGPDGEESGWGKAASGWGQPAPRPLPVAEPLVPNMAAVQRAVGAWKAFEGSPAQTYARRRGVSDELSRRLRLGYWKGWWQGQDSEWLTFPLRCPVNGRPVGVYGRNLHTDDQANKARVLGPRGLFGSGDPGPLPDELILVEGAFEVLALAQNPDLPEARAVIGASARAEWFDHCRRVTVLFDDDEPGREAAERLVHDLNWRRLRRNAGPRVFCLQPNTLAEQHDCKDLGALLERGVRIEMESSSEPEPAPRPAIIPASVAWDEERSFAFLCAAYEELGQRLPHGALTATNAELTLALEAAEIDLNAAYAAEDPEAFTQALCAFSAAVDGLVAACFVPTLAI